MVMHGSTKHVPRHLKEKRELDALLAPPPVAVRPGMPKLRSEVEPPTSNSILYGETPEPSLNRHVSAGRVEGGRNNVQSESRNSQGRQRQGMGVSSIPSEPVLLPHSYKPKDWESVTHAQFKPLPYVATSKEVQLERAVFQRSSELPLNEMSVKVFDPSVGFAGRETQMKTDFKPLEREWYVNRAPIFAIGGGGIKAMLAAQKNALTPSAAGGKEANDSTNHLQGDNVIRGDEAPRSSSSLGATTTSAAGLLAAAGTLSGQTSHSDVSLKMSNGNDPHAYESLMKRQFQSYTVDEKVSAVDRARRWENKKDMVASHFVIGTEQKVQYESSNKVPIAGGKPLVKNQAVSVAPENNPHLVKTVEDARPKGLTAKDVAYRKNASSVPLLTRNTPEFQAFGGQLPMTSTAHATPVWRADRRPLSIVDRPHGNGVVGGGGVRLGHFGEEQQTTAERNRSTVAILSEDERRRAASSLELGRNTCGYGGGLKEEAAGHGRRSATPSFCPPKPFVTASRGDRDTQTSNSPSIGEEGKSSDVITPQHGPNALRWLSSTKTAFKGFQYK